MLSCSSLEDVSPKKGKRKNEIRSNLLCFWEKGNNEKRKPIKRERKETKIYVCKNEGKNGRQKYKNIIFFFTENLYMQEKNTLERRNIYARIKKRAIKRMSMQKGKKKNFDYIDPRSLGS